MLGSLLAVVVLSVLLAGMARHFDVSAPLALVVAGLAASWIPGLSDIHLNSELVLFVLLPPLLVGSGRILRSLLRLKSEQVYGVESA